jgi:4-hydroxy-3-methylbut-2-enyl diphosphate reductase
MLVVGGRSSANTKRLQELCSAVTETHQIDSLTGIKRNWLKGKKHLGVTSGTSTSEESIDEIVKHLEES